MQTRGLQRALDDDELGELRELLAITPGAMSLAEARGFLTGVASSPTLMMPSEWQRELFGGASFSSMEQARHVFGLVMRLYNQIISDLDGRNPIVPSGADEDIRAWCTGYLKAARMDDVWIGDERGGVFLFPLAILAGEVDLVGEEDADGNVIVDPSPQLRRAREALDVTVHDANRYWTARRRENVAAPAASRPPKIGRNELCPCGSGRKFKKCCALNEH